MKIGLISDTHGSLPPAVFEALKGVDYILHAGDVGREEILTELQALGPVKAVYGNIDTFPLVHTLRRIDFLKIHHYNFCLVHAIGRPRSFAFELYKMNKQADFVIYGHTHHAEEKIYNGIHFINPGSVLGPGGLGDGTVALLTLEGDTRKVDFVHL